MNIIKYLSNLPGWRTQRKIVVIESDDWGSTRAPSHKAYQKLKSKGLNIDSGDNNRFNTLDTLASVEDFEALFNTLTTFKDKNDKHPVFTAMSLSANPDFKKIKAHDFSEYYYKNIVETLSDYGQENAFDCWRKGEFQKIFIPEFHGREHLNINLWMNALKHGDKETLLAFEEGFWGFKPTIYNGLSFQAAFYLDQVQSLTLHKEIIQSGVQLFEQLHHRLPSFFVPPNGKIHQEIINTAALSGMSYISSPKIYKEPQGNGKYKKYFRYLGKKGKHKIIYITRNCFFEPSYKGKGFSKEDCLDHIKLAFRFNKPAVISTHRVNYVGGLSKTNRQHGNTELHKLLKQMLLKWPDIEFLNSVELGNCIRYDKK